MYIPKILSYHKIGVPFDLSFCWHDRYSFIKHLDFYRNNNLDLCTISNLIEKKSDNQAALVFDDGFSSIYDFRDEFLERKICITIFAVTGFIGRYDRWEISLGGLSFLHLNTKELNQLSSDGHEIGSHSHLHRALTELTNQDLKRELITSKQIIEDITGKNCNSISMPFGRINQKVVDCCMESGYLNIVTTVDTKRYPAVLRARTVYGLDCNWQLKAKLGLNNLQKIEDFRLKLFSACAGLTVIGQKLLLGLKVK